MTADDVFTSIMYAARYQLQFGRGAMTADDRQPQLPAEGLA